MSLTEPVSHGAIIAACQDNQIALTQFIIKAHKLYKKKITEVTEEELACIVNALNFDRAVK